MMKLQDGITSTLNIRIWQYLNDNTLFANTCEPICKRCMPHGHNVQYHMTINTVNKM